MFVPQIEGGLYPLPETEKESVTHCVAWLTALAPVLRRAPFTVRPTDVEVVLGPEITKVLKSRRS